MFGYSYVKCFVICRISALKRPDWLSTDRISRRESVKKASFEIENIWMVSYISYLYYCSKEHLFRCVSSTDPIQTVTQCRSCTEQNYM